MPKLTKRYVEAIKPDPERDLVEFDGELHGFGVRVWPKGKRTYFLKYRTREGRQRKLTIGVHGVNITAEQARDVALQWLNEVRRGQDPANTQREAREMPTLAEFAERYLAKHARIHKKASSLANDERLLAKRILPALGRRKLNEVSREDVARLHEELQSTPYEANRLLALLSKMFNLAEDWGLRPESSNPCRRIRKFRERKRQRFLSFDELTRLGEVLAEEERNRTHSPSVFAAIKLLLFTGCRLSEILTLRWSEVDLKDSLFRLADSKTGEKVVYLNSSAREVLSVLKPGHGNPYVIRGAKAGTHLVNLEKPWQRIRERARLGDVRLHDLRHTFASAGAVNGLSLPMLGALLGHTQPATTNQYVHLIADPVRQANEVIGKHLESALFGSTQGVAEGAGSGSG
jgi:integrase